MTTKHMMDGLTMAMRTTRLAFVLGLDHGAISKLKAGGQRGMSIATLDHIHRKSGVSLDQLMAWYRLPEGAPIEPYRPGTISRASA